MNEKEGDELWYQDRGAEKAENRKVKMETGEEGKRRKDGSEYGSVASSRSMIAKYIFCVNSFYSTSI
jgi:hypothetical protein